VHEIRHWAQIATLLRLNGVVHELHDFLACPVMTRIRASPTTRIDAPEDGNYEAEMRPETGRLIVRNWQERAPRPAPHSRI
jgi:hypothetical protein